MESAVKNMVKQKVKELPADLILNILSKLPSFKQSVATRLISKHRNEPWKLVQDVTFEDDNEEGLVTLMSFVYGSLLSEDDDQSLERLHLKLNSKYSASDINFWVQVAVNRFVRKLRFDSDHGPLRLPRCLNNSKTLKSLILRDVTINHVPRGFCLPSLKSLHLFSVHFSQKASISRLLQSCPDLEYLVLQNYSWFYLKAEVRFCLSSLKSLHLLSATRDKCLTRLLQSCPVLENLVVTQNKRDWNPIFGVIPPASRLPSIKSLHLSSVELSIDESVATLLKRSAAFDDFVINRTRHDNVNSSSINVPTLKSLTIINSREKPTYGLTIINKENHGFWINAPALQTLNLKDTVSNNLMLEFMPEVTKENIEVTCDQPERFVGSLTSIQHLSICSPTYETPCRSGSVFPYLEYLELCTCSPGWDNLLATILSDAPRLQSLKLKLNHTAPYNDPKNFWKEPAVVPECLRKHLEIFEWRQYEDTVRQRKVAAYILANATCLKMATFSTRSRDKDHQIKTLNRISETCHLVFE